MSEDGSKQAKMNKWWWLQRCMVGLLGLLAFIQVYAIFCVKNAQREQVVHVVQIIAPPLVTILLGLAVFRMKRDGHSFWKDWALLALASLMACVFVLGQGLTAVLFEDHGYPTIWDVFKLLFYGLAFAALLHGRSKVPSKNEQLEARLDQAILFTLAVTVFWNANLGLLASHLIEGTVTAAQGVSVCYSLLDCILLTGLYLQLQKPMPEGVRILPVSFVVLSWVFHQLGDLVVARRFLTGVDRHSYLSDLFFMFFGVFLGLAGHLRSLPIRGFEKRFSQGTMQMLILFCYGNLWLAGAVGLLAFDMVVLNGRHMAFNLTGAVAILLLMTLRQGITLVKSHRLARSLRESNELLARKSLELAVLNEQIQRQGEARLKSVTDLFNDVFERAPIGMYLCKVNPSEAADGPNIVLEAANPAMLQMLGLTKADALQGIKHCLSPEVLKKVTGSMMECISTRQPVEYESEGSRHGTLLLTKTILFPVLDEEGRVCRLVGFVRDRTRSILTWRALQEAEERFEKAFQASPMFIFITEKATGRVLEVNDTFLDSTGQSRQNWLRLDSLRSGFWQNTEERSHILDTLAREGRIRNLEHEIYPPGRPPMQLMLNIDVVELHGNECLLTVAQDVTEWKLAQRQRQEAIDREIRTREEFTQLLIQRDEAEKRRVAGALHDSIGQDLLLVKNRAHLLKLAAKDNQALQDQVAGVNELVVHAIAEVRRISHDLRPYQLDHLGLSKALEVMLDQAGKSGPVVINRRIELVDDVFVGDSATNLYRVVQECLNNVLKHSGASRATVFLERDIHEVTLEVKDDGKGFDPEALAKASRGMGLGGMSERTAMLGGKLSIESSPGQGTRVLVTIPIQEKDELS